MEFFLKPEVINGIVVGVITIIIGLIIQKILERRSRLIYYITNVSAFAVPDTNPPLNLFFHSLVIRNQGKKEAEEVEICHNFPITLYKIYPNKNVSFKESASADRPILLIDSLAPGETITLTYLQYAPLNLHFLYQYIKSKEGLAKQITMALQRIFPKQVNYVIVAFLIWGIFCFLYFLSKLIFN